MHEMTPDQFARCLPMFTGDQMNLARAMLKGMISCRVFADDTASPSAALVCARRMGICFVAGDSHFAESLLSRLRGWHLWYEVIASDESWHKPLSEWSPLSAAAAHYSLTFAPERADLGGLRRMGRLPLGMRVQRMDAAILKLVEKERWSAGQLGLFSNDADFLQNGYGLALLDGDQLVACCSGFAPIEGGYELQIDTQPALQGKGYATIITAVFLQEMADKGLRASWDADSIHSLRLARRLGFELDNAYLCWSLCEENVRPAAM